MFRFCVQPWKACISSERLLLFSLKLHKSTDFGWSTLLLGSQGSSSGGSGLCTDLRDPTGTDLDGPSQRPVYPRFWSNKTVSFKNLVPRTPVSPSTLNFAGWNVGLVFLNFFLTSPQYTTIVRRQTTPSYRPAHH